MIARSLRTSLFSLCLVATLCAAGNETQNAWNGVERIVAVGDIHGDYDQFVKTLRLAGLVDEGNHWTGGKTHLVQVGDVLDRGPDSRKVMDLLMTLEKEAGVAGGMVHALIGNHETMVMSGDLKCTLPAEIESYGGKDEMQKALGPDGKYGSWIRKHNAVIKINDTLFLHAGLSAPHAILSLDDLNGRVREGLSGARASGLARDSAGPLWYRGLAQKPEDVVAKELEIISKTYGVRRVVIGHTVSKDGIACRANGQVVMIDVGMTKCYGGNVACLVIEGKNAFAVTGTGQTALSSPGNVSDAVPTPPAADKVGQGAPRR